MLRTIDDYCRAAMIRTNIDSLRKLADLLMVSPQLPSQWKTRRAWPSDSVMLKLADLAGIPKEIALLELEIWRTSDDARPVYEKMLQIISKTAAAFMLTLGLASVPFHDAAATLTSSSATDTQLNIHIMRQLDSGRGRQ